MMRRYSRPARLERGLSDAAPPTGDVVERFADRSLTAALRQAGPPGVAGLLAVTVGRVDDGVSGGVEQVVRRDVPYGG